MSLSGFFSGILLAALSANVNEHSRKLFEYISSMLLKLVHLVDRLEKTIPVG